MWNFQKHYYINSLAWFTRVLNTDLEAMETMCSPPGLPLGLASFGVFSETELIVFIYS